MTKSRSEIREGFLAWLKDRFPHDAERLFYATDYGVSILLNQLHETDDVFAVTDYERVDDWCRKMRTDDNWQQIYNNQMHAKALDAYRRYVEWLDLEQEREDKSALGAATPGGRAFKRDTGSHAWKHDVTDALGSALSHDALESASSGASSIYSIEITEEELIEEGAATEVVMTRYERNPRARQRCIEAYGSTYRCEVCGFNFEEVYGPRDAGQYIEVHHVAEHAVRSKSQGRHTVDCKRDLIPLCANCHRMIHHLRPQTLSPDELREVMHRNHAGYHAFKHDTNGYHAFKHDNLNDMHKCMSSDSSSNDMHKCMSSNMSSNMSTNMSSVFMNPKGEFTGWDRNLPHIHQEGTMQFITFRLADSLPQTLLKQLREEKEIFEKRDLDNMDQNKLRKFQRERNKKIEYWLSQGYGSCVLRSAEVRQIMIDVLERDVSTKCQILAYVLMPNHVHILLIPNSGQKTTKVAGSIRQLSAYRINKLLGRMGKLWSDEVWDRMIRDKDHMENCLAYIKNNPINVPVNEFAIYFNHTMINEII